ncbi:MAG: hypothetical protein ABFR75_12030 [Acidobacteriota bacterium]
MKTRIISSTLLILAFAAGFIYFEKKKREYGAELHIVKSEYNTIISEQTKIHDLKKKRADYFKKVFIINRPEDLRLSLTKFFNVLARMDNRSVSFKNINIINKTGVFDFEITGSFRRRDNLLDLMDRLESSSGAFILSREISKERRNEFLLKGEVPVE